MSEKRFFGFAEFSTWVSEKVDGALASVAASLGSKVDKTDDFGQYKVGELELAALLADLASGADLATLQQGFNDFVAAKASVDEAVAGTDDVKYITALSAKAAIESAVNELVGAAPEAMNTIYELADALENNPDVIANLTTMVNQKLDATATAVDSAKLEGFTKAQVIGEARNGLATTAQVAAKLDATATAADSAKLGGSTKAEVVAEAVAGSAGAIATKLDATATAANSSKLEGSTKAQVVAEARSGLGTASTANIFVSTVDPVAADGKDGDLWIKYTP